IYSGGSAAVPPGRTPCGAGGWSWGDTGDRADRVPVPSGVSSVWLSEIRETRTWPRPSGQRALRGNPRECPMAAAAVLPARAGAGRGTARAAGLHVGNPRPGPGAGVGARTAHPRGQAGAFRRVGPGRRAAGTAGSPAALILRKAAPVTELSCLCHITERETFYPWRTASEGGAIREFHQDPADRRRRGDGVVVRFRR